MRLHGASRRRNLDDISRTAYEENPLVSVNMDGRGKGHHIYAGPSYDSAISVLSTAPASRRRWEAGARPDLIMQDSDNVLPDSSGPPVSSNEHHRAPQADSSSQPPYSAAQASPSIPPPTPSLPSPQTYNHSPTAAQIYNHLTPAQQAAADATSADAVLQAQAEIEVDSDSLTDPGYGTDSMHSSNSSVDESVRDYIIENGRRYHRFREGSYNFPNDDLEQNRENLKHNLVFDLCGGRLFFAPIGDNPGNIMDMGTGTGMWAMEMGDLFPGASILGVDLSPIQPAWVPPGVKFMVDDVESPWVRPVDHYDYIHGRHTVMAIKDWPRLMNRVFEHLKPGGWFELQEVHHHPQSHDASLPPTHPTLQFWNLTATALSNLGVDLNLTLSLSSLMESAGFTNVSTRVFHIPIGTWPKNKILKQVGGFWREILVDGLSPIALRPYTRGLGWSKEQVESWLVEVRKGYSDSSVHAHMPLYIVCGQKPGGKGDSEEGSASGDGS